MSARLTRPAIGVTYALLVCVLVLTRLVGMDRSLWHDEVVAVVGFVNRGPDEILTGPELSHELFGVLAWATTSVLGDSEVVLRLWSVLPFILGVALVTAWLHLRISALSGILFLLLATVSPLLLDISRQARGYGLAFLAMGLLVVAAVEAHRTGATSAVAAFCAGGVIGSLTLPQFAIAFLATGVVLVAQARLRARAVVGVAVSCLAITAWYAPHIGKVREASQIEDGVRIGVLEIVVSPFDHILIPALLWIDGTVVVSSLVWLPLTLLAAVMMASSPLLRDRTSALILCAGVVATLVVLWIGRAYVIPRYLSFLLVPLFVLLSTGMASILGRLRDLRPPVLRTLACAVLVGLVTVSFLSVVADVVRYPREAYRDAADTIARTTSTRTPVFAYMRNTDGLSYYLDRPFRKLAANEVPNAVCESPGEIVFITQPFGIPEIDVPCLDQTRATLYRHRQYTRGDAMDVWVVRPG